MLGAGKTGSFALSQSKVDLFLMAITTYLDLIEEVFNTTAVPRLFALNPQFKCEELPKIRHEGVKDMDLKNMSDYISKLISVGAMTPDPTLSDYLRTAAGLPEEMEELEDEEEIGQQPPVSPVPEQEEKKPAGVKGKDDKEVEDKAGTMAP
jgi:phage gp29-like protein